MYFNISNTLFDKKSPVHREAEYPNVDRYTDRQTDIATYGLNRPSGDLVKIAKGGCLGSQNVLWGCAPSDSMITLWTFPLFVPKFLSNHQWLYILYSGTADQNWFTVVIFLWGNPSVNTVPLVLSFPWNLWGMPSLWRREVWANLSLERHWSKQGLT